MSITRYLEDTIKVIVLIRTLFLSEKEQETTGDRSEVFVSYRTINRDTVPFTRLVYEETRQYS